MVRVYLRIRKTFGTRRCPLEGAIFVVIVFLKWLSVRWRGMERKGLCCTEYEYEDPQPQGTGHGNTEFPGA